MSRWKWILSWLPLLAALLTIFTIWFFLFRNNLEDGLALLPKACPTEKPKTATRDKFEIVWRSEGCQAVPASYVQKVGDWVKYWNEQRPSIKLPALPEGTAIDIRRQSPDRTFWRLGSPGALLWQADSSPQGQYLLWKSLNELALREAFPKGQDLQLLAGALAVQIAPDGDLRLVLPPEERALAQSLPASWAKKLTKCQGRCLEKLAPR